MSLRLVSRLITLPEYKDIIDSSAENIERQRVYEHESEETVKTAHAIKSYLEIFEVTGYIIPMKKMLL